MNSIVVFILLIALVVVSYAIGYNSAQDDMSERLQEVMDELRKAHPEAFEDE